jgi:hypothetical protein
MRSVRGASSQPNVWLLVPLINIWQVALFKGVEPLSQDILFFLVMPYPTHPSAVIKMKWKSGTICLLATLDGQRAVTMFSSFCLFFKRLLTCLTVFYHQKWKKKTKKTNAQIPVKISSVHLTWFESSFIYFTDELTIQHHGSCEKMDFKYIKLFPLATTHVSEKSRSLVHWNRLQGVRHLNWL